MPPIRLFTHSSVLSQVAEMVQRTGYVDETENHPADTPGEIYMTTMDDEGNWAISSEVRNFYAAARKEYD